MIVKVVECLGHSQSFLVVRHFYFNKTKNYITIKEGQPREKIYKTILFCLSKKFEY